MELNKQQKIWAVAVGVGVVALISLALVYFLKKPLGGSGGSKVKYFSEDDKWYNYKNNKSIVENLHPDAVPKFKEFLSRVEKELKYDALLTSGYRSWEKQAELKKQDSRNASAGNSSHNYGFALDMNFLKDGKNVLMKATDQKKWEDSGIVKMAKEMGFSWGGYFSGYKDNVHFYYEPMERSKMKDLYLAGKKDEKGYIQLT